MREPINKRIIVGITGASGVIYGIRLLEMLRQHTSVEIHLILSSSAQKTMALETSYNLNQIIDLAHYHYDDNDMAARISSGSFKTDGMVILPCSIKTLSAVANSYNSNLLVRAADVTLKERRRLVLCVRETPLHIGHLQLMLQASQIGTVIMPLVPGFYSQPKTLDDMIKHSVMRVLDQLNLHLDIVPRWG